MSSAARNFARAYAPGDRDACLRLFDGNVPAFFATSERADFEGFLDQLDAGCAYQVIECDGRIVACGGHAIEADRTTASLCWGMVDRDLQRTGLGTMLTNARLRAAAQTSGVTQVRLGTSQHTQGFYARFGFEAERVIPDGYGPGLDRWDMRLRF